MPELRILIVAESASARFGGEAALPLHYFRVLRKLGHPVWLLTHARTRDELSALYPGDPGIRYVEDTSLNRAMWWVGQRLPPRLAYFTAGFVSRLATQFAQRRLARDLVVKEDIEVVHQPVPVSPREPSLLFGLGAPLVVGPMNGGMNFPEGFGRESHSFENLLIGLGRASARWLNALMPGKRRAALLLVANERTRRALPEGLCSQVFELVENGVDLALWQRADPAEADASRPIAVTRFIFLGRLVDWKGVDLLLEAFQRASAHAPMHLTIVGAGDPQARLEALAMSLGLLSSGPGEAGGVTFAGWLTQPACVAYLREADCLVLPSLLECGGAVVLEAMALSKPVIATAWGGPLDYLDAHCGILVAPVDRERFITGLNDAMVRLARSPAERIRMGAAGRQKIDREFDWDVKVLKMLDFYEIARTRRTLLPAS